MRIIFYLFWVVCLVRFCDGAVIANGKLEQCLKRDEDEMDCEERFIISLTAQNGEVSFTINICLLRVAQFCRTSTLKLEKYMYIIN